MGGCSAINCKNSTSKGFRMFNFPKDPERRKIWIINCRRADWIPGPGGSLCSEVEPSSREELLQRIAFLEKENEAIRHQNRALQKEVDENDLSLSFLSKEQISVAGQNKHSIANWSSDGILKGLKLRFCLGKHGYQYLRSIGYPAPAYSTLNRRIQGIDMSFGILQGFVYLLKTKVNSMDPLDRYCTLSVDEMEISSTLDFDTSKKCFVGHITLGNKAVVGNHYTVVLLRGLKSRWKQVIAHEITGPSTPGSQMKELIERSIFAARSAGLIVKATVSDMGSCNKSLWNSVGVKVTRIDRVFSYKLGNSNELIYSFADVPHLLKNIRRAFLSTVIILPENIAARENLPSKIVSSGYLKQLWIQEIDLETSLRSLYHLDKVHLFPNHFSAMNVATAVQLFSIKTAAAIEKSVAMKQINKDALTTAWFVRLIHEWFHIMTARHRIKSITKRNMQLKIDFLNNVIAIIDKSIFGKSWKPVQTGIIMSTLSMINLANELFSCGYSFFLTGRVTQDALENVFSQIRRKSSTKPTALLACRALKMICVSQFISDIKNVNYCTDSDYHLLDASHISTKVPVIETSVTSNVPSVSVGANISASEENDIYFMSGSTIKAVLKQKLCSSCINALQTAEDQNEPEVPRHRSLLNEFCNMGGLIEASSGVYRICREAERLLQQKKHELLSEEISADHNFVQHIKKQCIHVHMPECCGVKEKIITHYLSIRWHGIKRHLKNKRAYDVAYGSASAHKKNKKC